ncbi:hypothetical protein [Polyangium spumosum]|uniref:Uncharacterized protein n=1 Tax=Polyangium spumosum TaxID=889282 RepID=A0A6N7PUQ0_9BACT|nr:hypothetical protein [Polyangium spumosum]MRG92541.1 hypothetical protein [Polyangium spumosum]
MVYIPTFTPEELRAKDAAEQLMDAALEASGGASNFTFGQVQAKTPGLTQRVWRALINAYEEAGYHVKVQGSIVHDYEIVWLRYTPRVQKR